MDRYIFKDNRLHVGKSMKFAHISDLHIGKRVNEFSMLEDQRYILKQILDKLDNNQVEAVLIAGDIYDKTMPSAEAVALCDEFLTGLAARKMKIFIISGNHDCAERVAFGSGIMKMADIFIAPVFSGKLEKVALQDEYGIIDVYLLPFIKPAIVRRFYPDAQLQTYSDAVRAIIEHTAIDSTHRNILVAHQFVTGAKRSDSEEVTVGGIDNVDAEVFGLFDYVALGHIHGAQSVGKAAVRYCGTPLKYSFSEVHHQKSITIAEVKGKCLTSTQQRIDQHMESNIELDIGLDTEFGTEENNDTESSAVVISTIPLTPLHDLREVRGTYNDITDRKNYIGTDTEDYMHITLTDEEDIPDAIGRLRSIYPNIMKLDYDNTRTRTSREVLEVVIDQSKSPAELFKEFYELQNNQEMSVEQKQYIQGLVEEIW